MEMLFNISQKNNKNNKQQARFSLYWSLSSMLLNIGNVEKLLKGEKEKTLFLAFDEIPFS